MAPTISPEVAESSLQSVQVLRLKIKATVQLCNAMDCVELKQDCGKMELCESEDFAKIRA